MFSRAIVYGTLLYAYSKNQCVRRGLIALTYWIPGSSDFMLHASYFLRRMVQYLRQSTPLVDCLAVHLYA